ncbi:MAG: hypothetical protein ABIK37_03405 [candidate division WOR-3 bacterium]
MKTLIAALLLGLCLSTALAIEDGFLCTPYKNNQPAAGTIYCAYLNNGSMEWDIWTFIYSQGDAKRFCKDVLYADDTIIYGQTYKFCAWDGTHRSEWTAPVDYDEHVEDVYHLEMNICCPMLPDPKEQN